MVWMIIFDNIYIKAFGNIFSLLCNVYFDALDESRHKNDKRIELFLYCFNKQFFFHIFQVPERLYQLVDRSTDGLVTADQVMEFIAGLQAIR